MFKGSGSGQVYGPTYGTGDVVGCCVNMVDGTCFYTKNGVHLGKEQWPVRLCVSISSVMGGAIKLRLLCLLLP